MAAATPRSRDLLAVLLLLLLPAAMLGDSLFGGHSYAPYDLAEHLPVSANLTEAELATMRAGANYNAAESPIWFAPEWQLARSSLVGGQYPHWNPYVRTGAPLTASGILGLTNPLHWPAFLFENPYDGLLYLTYAMFALGGVLMYGLLRDLGLGPATALFGAIAFAWSGTMAANGFWYQRMEPLAMLPGMLWALVRLDRARGLARALPAIAFAVPTSLAWSACFPPFAIPCTLFCGLCALVLLVRRARSDGARSSVAFAAWCAFGLLLGFALAGATLAQQFAFFPVSNRPIAPSLASASRYAFDPLGLLGYLLPDPISHPGDRTLPANRSPLLYLLFSRTEWGTGATLRPDQGYNFTEYAVFPGTLPLLLAALGLLGKGPRWRFLCGGAVALLLLLAVGCGPFRFAYLIPGIQAVPPYRFAGPACVFVAILAALGFDRLRRGDGMALRVVAIGAALLGGGLLLQGQSLARDGAATEARWLKAITDDYRPRAASLNPNLTPAMITEQLVHDYVFVIQDDHGERADLLRLGRERLQRNLHRSGLALLLGAAFLGFVALRSRGRTPSSWWLAAATLATAAELWDFGHPLNTGRPLDHPLESPTRTFLREQRELANDAGGFTIARGTAHGGDTMFLPPGPLLEDRIRDLQFYTYVDKHSSEPFRRLYGQDWLLRDYLLQTLPDDARLQLPWWDALGVRYIVATDPMQFAGTPVGPVVEGPRGSVRLYERTTALPRAWAVPALRTVADDDAMTAAAIAPDFAPRDYALVLAADAAALPQLPADPAVAARKVRVLFEDLRRLVIAVDDGPPGYLVVGDTFLPGWEGNIDGFDAPIVRANVCQRVVPLPDRACHVHFRYRTPGLWPGTQLALGAAGLSVLLAAFAWWDRRRRRAR